MRKDFQAKIMAAVLLAVLTTACSNREKERSILFNCPSYVVLADSCGQEPADVLTNVLFKVTGRPVAICREKDVPSSGTERAFYVGETAASSRVGVSGEGLRNGDWRIKISDGNVFLFGRTASSTLSATTDFIERFCGYRFLTADGNDPYVVNVALAFAPCDITVRPAMYMREIYTSMVDGATYPELTPLWRRYARMRRAAFQADVEPQYRLSGQTPDCHSAFHYLPPDKYFKDHPEYYSMGADGARHGIPNCRSQLCYTNPDTYRLVLESLERFIRADRKKRPADYPTVYEFSQLDNSDCLCLCPECRKVIAKYNRVPGGHAEGGDAGLQLEFVNRLARDIRKKYPDVWLRINAYVMTERAPKPGSIRPEPNVIIWWTDLYSRSDHTIPLETPGHFNAKQLSELREWAELTPNIKVWDYLLAPSFVLHDFAYPEVPADALKADVALFARLGVRWIFLEMENRGQPFYELVYYLASKLYENPDDDVEALIRDYCQVYGAGAEEMYGAIAFLRRVQHERPAASAIEWHSRMLPWLDRLTLSEFARRVQAAYEKETSRRGRSRMAQVLAGTWKQLMLLDKNDPKARENFRKFGKEYARIGPIEPAHRIKMEHKIDETIELLTLRFKDLPPELRDVPEDGLVCVDFHRGDVVVDDPLSETGKAVRSRIDCDLTRGYPVSCGLHDWITNDGASYSLTREQVPPDGRYHWVRLGKVRLGSNFHFHFPWDWRSNFSLREYYVLADGLDVDPNWHELWASVAVSGPSFGSAAGNKDVVKFDRLVFRKLNTKGTSHE